MKCSKCRLTGDGDVIRAWNIALRSHMSLALLDLKNAYDLHIEQLVATVTAESRRNSP